MKTKGISTALCSTALALALTMSFGLVGCSDGGSSSSDSGSAAGSEEYYGSEEESYGSESAGSEASTDSTESSSSETVDVSDMNAWMGVDDAGETLYYAESTDGGQGVMVVYKPETNEYVSFVGTVSNPQPNYVTITDITNGNTLTFEVTAADEDGNVAIDMGEQGSAVLAKCDASEVVNAIAQIGTYGDAVA